MSLDVKAVSLLVVYVVAMSSVLYYVISRQPFPWLKRQSTLTRVSIEWGMFACVVLPVVLPMASTYVQASTETGCLSRTLNREFRSFSGIKTATPEVRAELKKEADLIATVLIRDSQQRHISLCDTKWEVYENAKSRLGQLKHKLGKILLGLKPSRDPQMALMQEVARERYALFGSVTDRQLWGHCTYRVSKIRSWLGSPRVSHPWSGWKVAKTAGSVTAYCTDKDGVDAATNDQ